MFDRAKFARAAALSIIFSASPSTARTLVINDDFNSPSVADNVSSGPASWYRQGFFGSKASSPIESWVSDGALHLQASDNHMAAVYSATPAINQQGWVGRTLTGNLYIEVRIRVAASSRHKYSAWPAVWMMAAEHMAGKGADQWAGRPKGFVRFAEDDLFEMNDGWGGPDDYAATLHEWFGIHQNSCSDDQFCQVSNQNKNKQNTYLLKPRYSINWSDYHVIGQRLKVSKDGVPGNVTNYLDGIQIGQPTFWSSGAASYLPGTFSDLAAFNVLDRQHLILILSSGPRRMDVDYVRVWIEDQ